MHDFVYDCRSQQQLRYSALEILKDLN